MGRSRTRQVVRIIATLVVLTPATSAHAQQFGASVAVDGGSVLVGAPTDDREPALVYVYRRVGDEWQATDTLSRPDAGGGRDYFGRFLAIDGDELIVGGTTFENSEGAAWRFRRVEGNWEFVDRLRPADVQPGDSFGRVGIAENGLLFVSALGHLRTGAVWVFRREVDGRWIEEAKLHPEDVGDEHYFGWSLAYDRGTGRLLVGAVTPGDRGRGAAYVYRREAPGQWILESALDPGAGAPARLQFGSAVGWLDGRALVGAPGADGFRGEIRVYERDRGTGAWNQELTFTAYDRQERAQFGTWIDTSTGDLWVGAPGADRAGRIYRISSDPANAGAAKIGGVDPEPGDDFGAVIAVGPEVAVVGQPGDDYRLGSAVILAHRGGDWTAEAKLIGPTPAPLAALTGDDVVCTDGQADQFPCQSVDILSFLPVQDIGGGRGAETNDVWGWTDPETGREYALVGRTDGTAFIDVTDPNRPTYLGNLPKTPDSRASVWRDIKVYNNHAYVVADGAFEHGMQIFDLTRLRDVEGPPATFEPDTLYSRIASAHNIVINEQTGFAYAVGANSGGETCGGALHIIDIREPDRPNFAGCFSDERTGRVGTGYTHDALCLTYDGPDREHAGKEICFASNETALSIADVTDKASPMSIAVADYPNAAYAHQGWITPDFKYFYMNDEGDEANAARAGQPMPGTRTLIWDVQDLDDPLMVKEHFGTTFTIDHNLYIKDDLMYQSNYVSGLRILDIRDPLNPTEVGYLDTVPWSEEVGFDGSWSNYPFFDSGTLVVSSGREGVFLLRYEPRLIP